VKENDFSQAISPFLIDDLGSPCLIDDLV